MATCKECVHVDACLESDKDLICRDYKDSSRFVELPCKVGDHLYVIFPENKYIAEYVVTAFWVEESGTIIRIVDTRFFTVSILFTRDIGTKAFLAKEQAEQALAKQNQPDNTPQ